MEDDDAVLDLDSLLATVVGAGAAAGAEAGIANRPLDAGDPDLVEPLALAAVRAGRDGDPDLDGQFLAEELFVDLLRQSYTVDDPELAVPGPEAGGHIHDLFPLGSKGGAVLCQLIEEQFELRGIDMRELHGLAGGEVEVFDAVPPGNLSQPLHLGRGDHACRHAETDDTEVGIAFCDDPSAGVEILVDRGSQSS